jgi:hypothetical protein
VAKRTTIALYYAEDKDVYDLLSSSKKSLSVSALQKVARDRGVFLSGQESRDEIVNYLARQDYSWPQIARLVELTETLDRPEKTAGSDIRSKARKEDLVQAAAQAKAAILELSRDDDIRITATPSGIRVAVTYSEPNYSKTRLHQRRIRDLAVSVEKVQGGFRVRHEANAKADAIVEQLVAALNAIAPAQRRTIALSGIQNPHLRTTFFIQMMKGVAGFTLDTVTSMRVARVPPEPPPDTDEDDDDDDDSSQSMKPEEAAVVAYVKNAALNGMDLLESDEYVALATKGFFLSRCVWQGSEKKGKRRVAQFEAMFAKADQATGFKYQVRGVYERNQAGDLQLTKVSGKNHPDLGQALEDAAHAALDSVEKAAVGQKAPTGKGGP